MDMSSVLGNKLHNNITWDLDNITLITSHNQDHWFSEIEGYNLTGITFSHLKVNNSMIHFVRTTPWTGTDKIASLGLNNGHLITFFKY